MERVCQRAWSARVAMACRRTRDGEKSVGNHRGIQKRPPWYEAASGGDGEFCKHRAIMHEAYGGKMKEKKPSNDAIKLWRLGTSLPVIPLPHGQALSDHAILP